MKTRTERHAEQEATSLSEDDKALIVVLGSLGFHQRRIAALFDVNQGRVAEVLAPLRVAKNDG